MSDTVIKVENLSKEYRLGVVGHDTLYRDLQSWWAKVRGKEDPNSLLGAHQITPAGKQTPQSPTATAPLSKGSKASPTAPKARSPLSKAGEGEENELKKHFLALNDVSFEVKQGDVLGIIGRNGAGKSTLLKILSRITSPSAGEIKIKGRLASLLEVGTGFHQELTGRENVYMNGAILGMRRHEIAKKMDEIIAFSGVEKFIDTPVKRYSSGMMVRLAFSVASNLDAEILVIDEVLAVGDAEFQKKCLGKMDDVAKKQGRTVLFVSHNMQAVESLCGNCILIENGRLVKYDEVKEVLADYLKESKSLSEISLKDRKDREGSGILKFTKIEIKDFNNNDIQSIQVGDVFKMRLYFDCNFHTKNVDFILDIGFDDSKGNRVAWISNSVNSVSCKTLNIDSSYIEIAFNRINLMPGIYSFNVHCTIDNSLSDWIQYAGFFTVKEGDYYKTGRLPPFDQGFFLMDYTYKTV